MSLHAQYQPCEGSNGQNSGPLNLTLNCGDARDTPICDLNHYNSGTQAEKLPIVEFRVNFHFVGTPNGNFEPLGPNNWSSSNGDTQAQLAIQEANSGRLFDLQPNQIYPEPENLYRNYLGDSRMRVALYTEPDEISDTHNGVWYHANITDYNSFILNNSPYGNKVVNVIVMDFPDSLGLYSACSMRGATPCGGAVRRVSLDNWYAAIQNNNNNSGCTSNEGAWTAGRILVHELLHNANLCHSYKLNNECAQESLNPDGDLDPYRECKGIGSTDADPSANCGLSDPRPQPCSSWASNRSDNIMTEGVQLSSLSRCQWTVATRSLWQNAHPWTNVCDVDETPLIISSNTTWNTLKLIQNREVIVESGAELNIQSCQIRMPKSGVIRVKRGAKLNMSSSTITNLCRGERWGGIYVEGNPNKPQPTINGTQAIDDAGIVSISNSTLTNGSHTIVTNRYQENWNSEYYGGLVDCLNTFFIDNKKGIAFYRHKESNNSRIRGCTFEHSGNNTFSANGGVSVWDCSDIEFSDNTFRNMEYGILPYNSKIKVLHGNTFNNLTVGIDIYSTHPNASEDIIGNLENGLGNSFSDNGHHIQINAGNDGGFSIIRYNDFNGASLPSIILDGDQMMSIIENSFDEDIFAFLSRQTNKGIVTFECNTVNGAYGIMSQGTNDNLIFNANIFNTNNADCFVEGYFGTPGSVFSTQGYNEENNPDNYSASNLFQNANTFSLDIVTSGSTVPFFYVNPTLSPTEYTPEVLDNNYILNPLDDVKSECEDIALGHIVGKPPYDEIKLNDIRQIENTAKAEAEANPNDPAKLKFHEETLRAKEKVLDWMVKNAVGNQQYAAAENYLSPEVEVRHKKSLYGVKVMSGNYAEAGSYLQTIPEENPDVTEFKMLQEINLSWLESDVPPGALLENGAVQNGNMAGNERGFYLSEAQNTFLNNVAFSGSANRSTARALLAIIKDERYTNPLDISVYDEITDEVRSRNNAVFTEKFGVYPNPTGGLLYVKLIDANVKAEDVSIELYDLSGQPVLIRRTEGTFVKARLNVAALTSGIYFLKVKNENNIFHQEKVVIFN